MEITRMLTLSTAHVTEEVCNALHHASRPHHSRGTTNIPFVVYEKSEYGYFIYITKDIMEDTFALEKCPSVLLDVAKFAFEQGCELLCLDRDCPPLTELKTYEW